MSTTPRPSEKGSDDSNESQTDVALIDEPTIRRLEDAEADESGCRFAAVARSLEYTPIPDLSIKLPCTRVAYVDDSGEYAIEREFFGHREDWQEVPRTVAVTDPDVVSEIPADHQRRYAPILATYRRVLAEE